MSKKRILICADFACPTGFSTVSENIAKHLKKNWDIDVLAINYHGDPHPLQKEYNIYPASLNGDVYGLNRVVQLVANIKYDIIFFINDIWIIDEFIARLHKANIPIPPLVWYTPVDAKHIKKAFVEPLNKTTYGVAYTEFGKNEIVKSGLVIPIDVIPHGIDTTHFHFMPKSEARKETGIPHEWFVVLNCNRNQIRKRLDLQVYYFAEWVKRTNKPETVKLYYHGALRDMGWDIVDLMEYYEVGNRLIVTSHEMTMSNMLPREKLKFVYNSADVFNTTCASEGWGLTLMEAMACGIPSLAPRSSALAEWPEDKILHMECHEDIPNVNTGAVNTIQDTPRLDSYIEQMEKLYNDSALRKSLGVAGWKHVTSNKFKWDVITKQFEQVFDKAIQRHTAINKIEIKRG